MQKRSNWLLWILLGVLLLGLGIGLLTEPQTQVALRAPEDWSLVISEICAKNETVIADNNGKYRDYIELHNLGPDVDLTGCRLTDGTTHSQPLEGITIPSGGYRLLFLGAETVGFALSASGRDSIQLQDAAGNILAQAKVRTLGDDQVMVLEDGVYHLSDQPSPGFSNDAQGRKAFLEGSPAESPSVVISEVLIANRSTLPDENGQFSDVLELHNPTAEAVSLEGWCLSDSLQERFRYRLPGLELPAGGYMLIFCDGGNYISSEGNIHANFALSLRETLCLTDPQGFYQTVEPQYPAEDMSLALVNGSYTPMAPSLGYPNTEEGASQALYSRIDPDSPLVISELLLSSSGVPYEGAFCDVVELWNRSGEKVSTRGWYLSDGGDPYQYPLPEKTLNPGEYMVITLGQSTTGFGLSDGETLYLLTPQYFWSQPLTGAVPQEGQSISLQAAGELSYSFAPPSLGYANDTQGVEDFNRQLLPAGLRISEVMTNNATYLRGPYGAACDWVELYNAGSETILLSDYSLSDDSRFASACPLPDKELKPGGYYVVMLTEAPEEARKGYATLPISLSATADTLYLFREEQVEDFVFLPELSRNISYGRAPGDAGWNILSKVTAGSQNAGAVQISAKPASLTAQGTYDGVEYLDVVLIGGGEIYYTTDCTVPNQRSLRYTGPIRLSETTVIRAVCYENGKSRSDTLDLTYILNENDNLPVISLVAHPDDLFGYSNGIYAWGAGDYGAYPFKGANFWQDWEKKTAISLFETDGSVGFSTTCGLKIFGGFSRALSKKSLACMFREVYGDGELNYPLFGDDGLLAYESFVLRAGGQDVYNARMRDEMITSLAAEHLQMPVQRFRPVVVYLNGEYWGIYYIREKLNDQYVAGNFNVEPEEVSIGEWTGDYCPGYKELRRWARSHDMTVQENYDQLQEMVNLQNYCDYLIAQMWIGNSDNGNVKFFKTTEHPWHWILFDTDQSFRSPNYDSVAAHLQPQSLYAMDTTSKTLILTLLPNEEFKEQFIRRIAWQMENVWTEENINGRIDEISAMIQPDVQKDCERWNVKYSLWESSVEHLRTFAHDRNRYFIGFVQKYFKLTDAQMRQYGFEV